MWEPPLFVRLAGAHRVLIAGAGGGFDIYAGLPLALALALRARGREVFLANLSFTALSCTDARQLTRSLFEVDARTTGEDRYFPERTLARWLHVQGLPDTVYAFDKVGVRPLRAGYEELVRMVRPDAIVLVDGGTDLLMRGDEAGLGTPEEDMTSLAAIADLLGFPYASPRASASASTRITACVTRTSSRTWPRSRARARTSARSLCPPIRPRRAPSSMRSPRLGPRRRGGPASSTGRSPLRSAASSATCSSPRAPPAASCSSTRSWRCTSPSSSRYLWLTAWPASEHRTRRIGTS